MSLNLHAPILSEICITLNNSINYFTNHVLQLKFNLLYQKLKKMFHSRTFHYHLVLFGNILFIFLYSFKCKLLRKCFIEVLYKNTFILNKYLGFYCFSS